MAEDQVANLTKARENLIEQRNHLASDLAGNFERTVFWNAVDRMVKVQVAIDAINRALEEYGQRH